MILVTAAAWIFEGSSVWKSAVVSQDLLSGNICQICQCNSVGLLFLCSSSGNDLPCFCFQGVMEEDGILTGDGAYNAHFGECIASIGDIDDDGYQGQR